MTNKQEKFNPPKLQCNNCEDIIYSTYPGEWVSCSCFRNTYENTGVYIDSTREYTRVGGDHKNYSYIGIEDDE